MELESFNDVVASIQRNKNRPFHLLIGNGFSMSYDPKIFSYNALHDFIEDLDDADLLKILRVIETKNFELIMQQLDSFAMIIESLGGDNKLKKKVATVSMKLRTGLLEAVKSLHPEHVFKVPEKASERCSRFLRVFLESGGKIFSTNYDLLLYWILMRNNVNNHCDGFGRRREDSGEFVPAEEQQWSELIWGKHRAEQNVFYLHGALPFFDDGVDVIKEEYDGQSNLLQKISDRMKKGEYPVFVTGGDGRQKLSHIMHNHYLAHCYDSLCTVTGSLVTFGFGFGQYDEHIIDAINRATKSGAKEPSKLWSLYIGVYSDEDRMRVRQIESRFKCKVHIFDTKTVNVWGT